MRAYAYRFLYGVARAFHPLKRLVKQQLFDTFKSLLSLIFNIKVSCLFIPERNEILIKQTDNESDAVVVTDKLTLKTHLRGHYCALLLYKPPLDISLKVSTTYDETDTRYFQSYGLPSVTWQAIY